MSFIKGHERRKRDQVFPTNPPRQHLSPRIFVHACYFPAICAINALGDHKRQSSARLDPFAVLVISPTRREYAKIRSFTEKKIILRKIGDERIRFLSVNYISARVSSRN